MPRPDPDVDRVREMMAREAEEVASAGTEPGQDPPEPEPDALPEQRDGDQPPPDSDDPDFGPVTES